jgi:ectoine hydroxylase-related dioxygenase (phytanoyl-CoA dioxygenase family)
MHVETALTADERQRYEREGYLVRPGAFGPDEVARMRREADYVLTMLLNSALANDRPSGRIDAVRTGGGDAHVRKIQPVNDLSLYFSELAADERIVGPMRELMGSEPNLMEEKLNYKQPVGNWPDGLPVKERTDHFEPHNDWAYYSTQGYPQDIMSTMLVMDDCTVDNGPLVLWKGSHRHHLEHVHGAGNDLTVDRALIDLAAGEDLLAEAGSVVYFHALLIHSSRPNGTDRPRRLMIYSHYPGREDHGVDVRNGPTRLRETPWEHNYLRRRIAGEIEDAFRLEVAAE